MTTKGMNILKTLVIAYVITGILLLLIAFGLFRFHLSDWQTTAAIVVTYALASFTGGYLLARAQKSRRLLWGIGFGVLYFTVLAAVSLVLGKGTGTDMTALIRALIICALAGGIGAFATPE